MSECLQAYVDIGYMCLVGYLYRTLILRVRLLALSKVIQFYSKCRPTCLVYRLCTDTGKVDKKDQAFTLSLCSMHLYSVS